MWRRSWSLAIILAIPACVEGPSVPKLGGSQVELTISNSSTAIAPGEADTITVTAVNHLTDRVRITFSVDSPCQILVYIRDRLQRTVIPSGGSYRCVPVGSQLVIEADSSVARTFVWTGASALEPSGSATRLPAGTYYVTAQMAADGFTVPAFAVTVTLLP